MRNVAGGRVIAEIRHAQRTGNRCPASPHDIELILKTLKRDQELLESILDAECMQNSQKLVVTIVEAQFVATSSPDLS